MQACATGTVVHCLCVLVTHECHVASQALRQYTAPLEELPRRGTKRAQKLLRAGKGLAGPHRHGHLHSTVSFRMRNMGASQQQRAALLSVVCCVLRTRAPGASRELTLRRVEAMSAALSSFGARTLGRAARLALQARKPQVAHHAMPVRVTATSNPPQFPSRSSPMTPFGALLLGDRQTVFLALSDFGRCQLLRAFHWQSCRFCVDPRQPFDASGPPHVSRHSGSVLRNGAGRAVRACPRVVAARRSRSRCSGPSSPSLHPASSPFRETVGSSVLPSPTCICPAPHAAFAYPSRSCRRARAMAPSATTPPSTAVEAASSPLVRL